MEAILTTVKKFLQVCCSIGNTIYVCGGGGGLRSTFRVSRSRIHERTISLRFLGIILRVLRREVSAYNV